MASDVERRDEAVERFGGDAAFWTHELELSDKTEKDWRERAEKIVKRYRDERDKGEDSQRRFNILWSNTETLKANLLGAPPSPDIRRRWQSEDDTGRQMSQILERALSYTQDQTDGFHKLSQAVEDHLLAGRGVIRVLYEPAFTDVPRTRINRDTGEPETVTQEEIADQRVTWEYVYWEDFRRSAARTWDGVWWVAFRHILKRDELERHFGDVGRRVPLNVETSESKSDSEDSEAFKRAEVWEIWDKDKRERVYVVKGFDELLDKEDDPLGLERFFPVPHPLYSVSTTSSLVPVPEYTIYQDQAEELDRVTERINAMVEAIKRRGVYDSSVPELKKVANAGDNEFIPTDNPARLYDKGGLENVIQHEDMSPAVEALQVLYQQRDSLLSTIYEVTGISDIMRGQSDARETATAQQQKARFGSMRVRRRQQDIQMFVRDLYEITAEVMAEHFQPQILGQITGMEVDDQTAQTLRNDRLRGFKIDIEADSTVLQDDQEEKQRRMEFVQAVSGFMQQLVPAVQEMPSVAPAGSELLMFAVRGFKVGRSVEEELERMSDALRQQAAEKAQQPSEEERKVQMEIQKEREKLEIEKEKAALEHQRKRAELALDAEKQQHDQQLEAFKTTHQATLDELKTQIEAQNKVAETITDDELKRLQQQTDDELRRQKTAVEIEEQRRKGEAQAQAERQRAQAQQQRQTSGGGPPKQ